MTASRVTRLSPLVRVVLAPNPSLMTLEGTNTYVIGGPGDGAIVLDPGPADDDHLERVRAEAGEVSLVLLTHWHPDHAEGADRLAGMCGAPIAAAAGSRDDAIALGDGEEIGQDIGQGRAVLRALATPGHSGDHLCFLLEDEGTLFTGDHILGFGTSVVAPPDGDMEAYVRSLERLRDVDARRMFPGHGPVIDEPAAILEYYIDHRLERERQVMEELARGPVTVGDLVAAIYSDVDPGLHPAAALTVAAHLAKLEREGLAREEDGRWTAPRAHTMPV